MSNKFLLREWMPLCPDGVCDISRLTESERRLQASGKNMFLTGIMQRADAKNGNGRIYPYDILRREDENYQQLIKERRALGELDHPEESVVSLANASHLVVETWWKGKELWGKIKILSNSKGRDVQAMINDGVQFGISSRGMGSVHESQDGTIVENDFQLLCYDLVTDPSTTNAFMNLSENKIQSLQNKFWGKKSNNINLLMENILKKVQ